MHEAIADRIGDGRITEGIVPSFRRQLRREHGRRAVVTILEYLEQIAFLAVGHRCEQEVVEHEHVDLRDACERGRLRAGDAGDRELFDQTRPAHEEGA